MTETQGNRYTLEVLDNGVVSFRHAQTGEILHGSVGPEKEATELYIDASGLGKCGKPEVVVFDVGTGCGAQLMALLDFLKISQSAQEIHVYSFDLEKEGLRAVHMGYIFQVFNLLPFLSVMENILLPVQMNKHRASRLPQRASAREEARRLAEKLSIGHLLDEKAGLLSVGQQQRVAAARALIGNPDLIVADEPTSALDSDLRESFISMLFEQAREQNSSVLFVSHDRSLMPLFDRGVALADINQVMKGAGA